MGKGESVGVMSELLSSEYVGESKSSGLKSRWGSTTSLSMSTGRGSSKTVSSLSVSEYGQDGWYCRKGEE